MQVLLTNDDGRREPRSAGHAPRAVGDPGVELAVVAPDGEFRAHVRAPAAVGKMLNSTTAPSATRPTVNCVRLAKLGLIEGFVPPTSSWPASTTARTSATEASPTRARSRRARGARARPPASPSPAVRHQGDGLPPRQPLRLGARGPPHVVAQLDEVPAGTLLNTLRGHQRHPPGPAPLPRRAQAGRRGQGPRPALLETTGADPGFRDGPLPTVLLYAGPSRSPRSTSTSQTVLWRAWDALARYDLRALTAAREVAME